MTHADQHATPPAEPPHDTATETHSEPDEHEHDGEELGPIDVWAWGAGALGLLVAVVMAACFVLATSVVASG
jgi:hypothetical protein